MALSGISPSVAPLIQSTLDLKTQLDKLQQQLGTGQKSDNYAGLGSQGGIAVSLNAQLAALGSFDSTMTVVGTTINLQQQVLQQVGSVGSSVQTSVAQPSFTIDNTGQTPAQQAAASQLDQVLGLLNTEGGNGYLFSGTSPDQPSVNTTDNILNGNGTQAGLKQVIAERLQGGPGDRWALPAGHSRARAGQHRRIGEPRMPRVRRSGSSSPRSVRRTSERS